MKQTNDKSNMKWTGLQAYEVFSEHGVGMGCTGIAKSLAIA